MAAEIEKWWDSYDVPLREWARWRIGPIAIYAQAQAHEWILGHHVLGAISDDTLSCEIPLEGEPDRDACVLSRHILTCAGTRIKLGPRLGDRPFIVRPELPLFVMPDEKVTLYVTTLVWITISTNDDRKLLEVPALRPSDTWFGPNTQEGELCYASRTSARTDAAVLGRWPHRAATPIEITNEGSDRLQIEQLRVPVPALALYENEKGQLWTDKVSFVRRHGQDQVAELTVPRAACAVGTRLVDPRAPVEARTIVRAFSQWLS